MFEHRFDGTDDFFDSRDAQARIDELIAEFDDALEGERETDEEDMSADDWAHMLTEDDAQELAALIELRRDVSSSEWGSGMTFLHDAYFEDYAREFASDVVVGYSSQSESWPFTHIDWGAAANDLQTDYTSYDFRDGTYWARP
jgi:hypothetical protein